MKPNRRQFPKQRKLKKNIKKIRENERGLNHRVYTRKTVKSSSLRQAVW
jgi:hypothetical protein